jgi:trans-aconitate methyltransferase
VYPKFVARGSMTQQEADAAIAKLEAAYATLKWVEKHRDRLKQLAPELDPSSSGAP